MRFAPRGDHPGIERVVDDKPVPQHDVIVWNVDRQPKRNRKQTSGLWGKVHAVGIGAPDDVCDPGQRRICEVIILNEGDRRNSARRDESGRRPECHKESRPFLRRP